MSADGSNAYVADGLHDELLSQLAQVSNLKVIGRTSVMEYAGQNEPPIRQIAREQRVGSVVEGRLRVQVQLVDVTNGEQLWAKRYDRTLEDTFPVQSDLAQ